MLRCFISLVIIFRLIVRDLMGRNVCDIDIMCHDFTIRVSEALEVFRDLMILVFPGCLDRFPLSLLTVL